MSVKLEYVEKDALGLQFEFVGRHRYDFDGWVC